MFEWPLRVYIEDTDAGGIVYYANYLKFFERARSEWLRAIGFDQQVLMQDAIRFVVREVNVKYRQPALLDDEIIATVEVAALGKASMTLNQRIVRRSDNQSQLSSSEQMLAEGSVSIACIDENGRPRVIPKDVAQQISMTVTTQESS
ncbi:tol-pal system-associated acyl-CoA thioesterase [Thalassolituus oleivorans]|uniref:tol-pal system-associated acyl-CoA thioesterase n=1 Tax=Thalassolituus oleivorans TaxID=187493 RepID=UPI0023F0A50F|nr:tol-pal system-associated acyl-CoA thioesterase [Thalassolituus oleivorans]